MNVATAPSSLSLLLMALALGVPLALLLVAVLSRRLRRRLPVFFAFAPLPALGAAIAGTDGAMLGWGNANFALRFSLDAAGAMLLGAAALLWCAAGVHAAWYLRRRSGSHGSDGFIVCWLMALTGCVGVFLAADVVGFYFLLALLSVGASGLVLQGEGNDTVRAGAAYLGVALLAEAILLPALILLVLATPDGSLLIGDAAAAAALPHAPLRDITIILLLAGLGMKAGLVPLHFWMPLAYGAAPTPAAAVMSGAIVKAAILALIRFLPLDSSLPQLGLPLAALGLFGAFYGVVVGIMQSQSRHILAYSSVSQMGFMAAILGMGLAAGDAGAGLATAFYATHHLLVKGALFLAVGVVALTGRHRLRWTLVPVAVIALGLGGLPLTGGALAKHAAKDLLGEGMIASLAALTSVTSTVLMIHFLRRLYAEAAQDADARAPVAVAGPWLAMAVASVTAPWALYLAIPASALPASVSFPALAGALWPVLLGGVIAILVYAIAHRLPSVPPGDLATWVANGLGNGRGVVTEIGRYCEGLDMFARHWTVATLAFVAVALVFVSALAFGWAYVPSG